LQIDKVAELRWDGASELVIVEIPESDNEEMRGA